MDNSLFIESLKMILEESNQFYVMMDNTYYVQENKISDFLKKIKVKDLFETIFSKFIDTVNNIWSNFKEIYFQLGKNSTLKKYRKDLENADWEINYPESRLIFTNLDNSATINFFNMNLNREYNDYMNNINKIISDKKIESIYANIINIKENIIPIDTYLDQKRGESINKNYNISEENYAKELILYFKSDKTIAPGIVFPKEIKSITEEYFESKTLENTIIKDKKNLIDSAKSILSKINSIKLPESFPDKLQKDIYNNFTEIIREYCKRVNGLCIIYTQLFSMKLDMFRLYKKELTKILSIIILESKKEGKIK